MHMSTISTAVFEVLFNLRTRMPKAWPAEALSHSWLVLAGIEVLTDPSSSKVLMLHNIFKGEC